MAIGDRPDDYALHATTSPAKVSLPTNYMFGGFAVRNKLPHDLANTLFGAAGDWQAYIDAGPVRWSEANGLDLSLDNMTIREPTLDAGALMSSVFDRLTA